MWSTGRAGERSRYKSFPSISGKKFCECPRIIVWLGRCRISPRTKFLRDPHPYRLVISLVRKPGESSNLRFMILDHLHHADRSTCLHPLFPAAFQALKKLSADTPIGKIEVKQEQVFILVQNYRTSPAEEKNWEAHRKYLDIQLMLAGREKILHAPTGELSPLGPYQAEKDVQLFHHSNHSTELILNPGDFAIFYPEDGHKPGCLVDGACEVTKAVAKVWLES
jgi:biofilm protein TabA